MSRVIIGVVEFKQDNAKGRLCSIVMKAADAFWERLYMLFSVPNIYCKRGIIPNDYAFAFLY